MFHFDIDFVDRNSERFMFPIRIKKLISNLYQKHVVRQSLSTGDFEYTQGDLTYAQLNDTLSWNPFKAGWDLWGEPDQWAWFRQTVTIPQECRGEDIWYYVSAYSNNQDWEWGHPQAQLFVNGVCVAGLDSNHREQLLVKNAQGGETLDIAIKLYSDLTYYKGPMTLQAWLRVLRPNVRELYYSMDVPMQAASLMPSDSEARIQIVKALNAACNILEIDAPSDSQVFLDSVERTHAYLKKELYGTLRHGQEPVMWAIGHTHIDVAWQWTYRVSRSKAIRSFATTLQLMERNPDYLFMSSQPVLYEFVRDEEPTLFEQIRQRVAQGRWEAEGGMYVEADTNLTGGESLVRQLLVGKRFFRKEFGVENRILWLPDVFGFSANLPQICKKKRYRLFLHHQDRLERILQIPLRHLPLARS